MSKPSLAEMEAEFRESEDLVGVPFVPLQDILDDMDFCFRDLIEGELEENE